MRYTTIIKYVREGDFVTPVRYSQFHGVVFARVLDMAHLYAGHTAWIADDIAARQERYAPVKRAA